VASAPMLSHGGSRLNASKPEANPKTSCPKTQLDKKLDFGLPFSDSGAETLLTQKKERVASKRREQDNRNSTEPIGTFFWYFAKLQ